LPALGICHPSLMSNMPQYIIGYGSLMENKSKKMVLDAGQSYPVIIHHYKREWNAKGNDTGFSTTYLNVLPQTNASFNAVIFALPENAIKLYDNREEYYCRIEINPKNIEPLKGIKLPQGQFWLYESKPDHTAPPDKRFPITQSYVDVFLSGCLDIEQTLNLSNFADTCILTTYQWSPYWVNDRIFPRRPLAAQPNAEKIDHLLAKNLPDIFPHIKIEGE
jgi:hypothetical protein